MKNDLIGLNIYRLFYFLIILQFKVATWQMPFQLVYGLYPLLFKSNIFYRQKSKKIKI
jgi:hypothetical protein